MFTIEPISTTKHNFFGFHAVRIGYSLVDVTIYPISYILFSDEPVQVEPGKNPFLP